MTKLSRPDIQAARAELHISYGYARDLRKRCDAAWLFAPSAALREEADRAWARYQALQVSYDLLRRDLKLAVKP